MTLDGYLVLLGMFPYLICKMGIITSVDPNINESTHMQHLACSKCIIHAGPLGVHACYGLNIRVPPKFVFEALSPSGMVYGGGPLGED